MTTHPDRPDLAYSAAGDGFYVTEDGGDTWRTEEAGLDRTYCWSVACDPADPGRLLVSAAHGPRSAHDAGSANSAVYRMDGGDWERCEALPGPEGLLAPVLATTGEADEAFAATNRGFYRTDDWGASWQPLDGDFPRRWSPSVRAASSSSEPALDGRRQRFSGDRPRPPHGRVETRRRRNGRGRRRAAARSGGVSRSPPG